MPVLAHKSKLAFYAVPKNACSSVKLALHRSETGYDVSVDAVHNWSTTNFFEPAPEGYTTFCIIREPVQRFVSGYLHRIVQREDLRRDVAEQTIAALGLEYVPGIEDFALNIAKYAGAAASVDHHFSPQARFLGSDLGYFDEVFAWNDFDRLGEFIARHTGVLLPAAGRTSAELTGPIPGWLPAYLATFYAGDYALLRDYYRSKL